MDKSKVLKNLIKENYKSVKEFALECNLPYTTVYTILQNGVGKANVNNVIAICQKLNISVEQLYKMANSKQDITEFVKKTDNTDLTDKNDGLINYRLDKFEKELIDMFRSMNKQGQEYLLQTADMAKDRYIKTDNIPLLENID